MPNEAAVPEWEYLIDPERYLRIAAEAAGRGLEVIGVWHSHPLSAADPSATDRAQAWPDWHYLIIGWPTTAARMRIFWSDADGLHEESMSP